MGMGIMLGVAVTLHQAETSAVANSPALRTPTIPTGQPAIVTQAPRPAQMHGGGHEAVSPDTALAMNMAKSTDSPIHSMRQESPIEVRAANSLLEEILHAPKALLINPLPEPEYRPFLDRLNEHLRAVPPKAEGIPPVYMAVLFGDVEWLQQLLREGHTADACTPAGDTALCAAVWFGNEECVRSLLLYGANPNLSGRAQQPPIALASLRRSHEILKALLLAGADANARFAAPLPENILDIVTVIDLKASLKSDRGVTPLIACTARGDVEGVLALMQHGAKTELPTTKFYRYPINFACTQKYIYLSRILLGRSPDQEPDLVVTVNLSKQRAWITKNGRVVDSTSISTGREGFSTPTGHYVVTDKHTSWTSTLYKVPMPWFMRLDGSAIGLHSGHVTGRPASHGCIRLPNDKARDFFRIVRVGDEVKIVH
jgi:hypothetical protein